MTRRPTSTDTPIDLARRAWAEHLAECPRCQQGLLPCDACDALERVLTEAASGDLPWPATCKPD